MKRQEVHGAFDIKSFVWTAWTRSGLVLSEWLQSYGERKQRRCWIRTPHGLPLKAVGLLVSSLGHRQGLHCCPVKPTFPLLCIWGRQPWSISLLLPPAAPSFFLRLLMLVMKYTLTFPLCRAPHQDSPGSLCSQQFILFPWWNVVWVFPHSFQSNISDVRSLLRFFPAGLSVLCSDLTDSWHSLTAFRNSNWKARFLCSRLANCHSSLSFWIIPFGALLSEALGSRTSPGPVAEEEWRSLVLLTLPSLQ